MMREWLESGRLIDLALAVTAAEWITLAWRRRVRGAGLAPAAIAGQLLAGVMLLLALRSALRGDDYRLTLAFFCASLPAHLYDLLQRVRGAKQISPASAPSPGPLPAARSGPSVQRRGTRRSAEPDR